MHGKQPSEIHFKNHRFLPVYFYYQGFRVKHQIFENVGSRINKI